MGLQNSILPPPYDFAESGFLGGPLPGTDLSPQDQIQIDHADG